MTIKQMEQRAGLERANIRFYETEGLLKPARMENGYRDYSEQDLEQLLRVKLLRSLRVSVEEIKELQNGKQNLSDTLIKQMERLEQEQKSAAYAKQICTVMRDDQVEYTNLNAQKYLNGVEQTDRGIRTSFFASVKSDALPQVYYPWRRFFARTLDYVLYATIWMTLFQLVFRVNMAGSGGTVASLFIAFLAPLTMLLAEPLLLHFFGATLGKAVFGLSVEMPDGQRVSYEQGFQRTWGVLWHGLGLYIPIFDLVCLWRSYKICSENETEPWDDRISYTIQDTKGMRGVVFAGCLVLLMLVSVPVGFAAQLPPHRGDLTVAEFAENFNCLARYYELDFSGKILNAEGQWEDYGTSGNFVVNMYDDIQTSFSYQTEGKRLTGIRMEAGAQNIEWMTNDPSGARMIAALAFAGAQKQVGMFSDLRQKMVEELAQAAYQDFSFEMAGVNFFCESSYEGLDLLDMDGFLTLTPQEGTTENFYHATFEMTR